MFYNDDLIHRVYYTAHIICSVLMAYYMAYPEVPFFSFALSARAFAMWSAAIRSLAVVAFVHTRHMTRQNLHMVLGLGVGAGIFFYTMCLWEHVDFSDEEDVEALVAIEAEGATQSDKVGACVAVMFEPWTARFYCPRVNGVVEAFWSPSTRFIYSINSFIHTLVTL